MPDCNAQVSSGAVFHTSFLCMCAWVPYMPSPTSSIHLCSIVSICITHMSISQYVCMSTTSIVSIE